MLREQYNKFSATDKAKIIKVCKKTNIAKKQQMH